MFLNRDQDSEVKAKRPLAIPPLRPEFDNFLYAETGEFSDDMPLSVLSALARRNLDPWEEAAMLAQLPPESAIVRLTSMTASVTAGPTLTPIPAATAARLIALLPRNNRLQLPPFFQSPIGEPRLVTPMMIFLVVGAIILASALLGN